MENGVGTFEGSGFGEKNGFLGDGFELKVDKVDMGDSNGLKDSEGDDVFEEATSVEVNWADSKEEKSIDDSLEADGMFAGNETDKFEEAVEEQNHQLEEALDIDVTVNTDDECVNMESDRDGLILSATGGSVDNTNHGVREVPDSVIAAKIVSENGVEGSEDSNVVIEDSQNGFPISDDKKTDRSVDLEAFVIGITNTHESQLPVREFGRVDANEGDGGPQWQIPQPKEDSFCETDKDLEINEIPGISNTDPQDDKDGDLNDVPDGSHCDEKADMFEESFDLGTGDGIALDDGITVSQMSGVPLQKWQNGVSFSKILNSNGFEGGEHESQLQNTDSIGEMLSQSDKNVNLNTTSAIISNTHPDDKFVHLEDVSAGSHSGQQADKAERPWDKLATLDTGVITDSTGGLEGESSARLGLGQLDTPIEELTEAPTKRDVEYQDDRSPHKDLSVTVEIKHHKESSILDDNLNTSVEESSETLEVGITPLAELSSKEDDKVKGYASHVGKSLNGSVTQQKNSSVEKSNFVAGKIEKEALNSEGVKQTTGDIRESETRPVAPVPSPSPAPAPAPALTPAPTRPAGLGRATPLLESSSRTVSQTRVNGTGSHTHNQVTEESANGDAEENDETREKLQMIRVKFLRLAHRLGQTPHNVVVAQVLYRLGLAEQLRGGNGGRVATFSFDRASAMAVQLESAGQEPLDFSCTIMVLGKTGVGKSATINSIFDQVTFGTDAFQLGTKKVQDVVGTVQGIKVRVIDTPGLLSSWSDQHRNEKILHSVRRFIKKSPPDIVLYLDRLDMQSRDSGDMPLLRTITDTFGPSIWFNAIVVLTHAASAPPDGPNGVATSYDMFVTQRSHVVQQAIREAAGDVRLMNPVSLVENHSACRTNRAGQRVLPNGQVWKPHLLLLSFASKILAEANTLLKLQNGPPGKPFTARARAPPLPFLLTSLLRSRPQLKLPHEQYDDDDDTLDDDLDDPEYDEYDELPPFKHLTRAQLAELSKSQRMAYYDELEYREKLFMKKQLREEKQRRRMMKKMAAADNDMANDYRNGLEEETGGETSAPVPMADLPLPASFDADNPTHRYRFLDTTNQWLVRPVHDSHSWDHDVGYEGVNMERSFVIKNKVPMSFSGQVTKDKKEAHFQMEVAGSVKHAEGRATTLGFDMQQIGKDIAYTLRTDTKFSNFRHNKATASLSVTHMGDVVTTGVKVEDKLIVTRRAQVVISGGVIAGRGDIAYGGSMEATLRDKDFPLGRFLTTMSFSLMDWHGDLATGWNAQTQIPIGRFTNLIGSVNFNNRGQGQVSIRLNSSEQLQIALVALVPLFRKLLGYSQQMQFEY